MPAALKTMAWQVLACEERCAELERQLEITRRNWQSAAATVGLIGAMVGEMFGPIANIESEEATLRLRGPEASHRGEAILEALQRVQEALAGRGQGLDAASRATGGTNDMGHLRRDHRGGASSDQR